MDAFTYKLKTPMITGGRSHIPLADTELMSVGINYYAVGRQNKLHAGPGAVLGTNLRPFRFIG